MMLKNLGRTAAIWKLYPCMTEVRPKPENPAWGLLWESGLGSRKKNPARQDRGLPVYSIVGPRSRELQPGTQFSGPPSFEAKAT